MIYGEERSSPMVPSLCLRCSLLHMNILLLSGLYATHISQSLSLSLPYFFFFIPLLSLSLSLFMSPRAYFSPLWSSAAYASNDRPFQILSPPMKSDYFGLAARHSAENEKIISLTNSESLYSSLNTWLRSPALLLAKISRSRL